MNQKDRLTAALAKIPGSGSPGTPAHRQARGPLGGRNHDLPEPARHPPAPAGRQFSVGLAVTRMVPGLYPTAHGCKRRLPAWDSAALEGIAEDFARSEFEEDAFQRSSPGCSRSAPGPRHRAAHPARSDGNCRRDDRRHPDAAAGQHLVTARRVRFPAPRPPSAAAHVMSAHSSMPTASPRPLRWSVRSPPLLRGTGADTAARPLSAWPLPGGHASPWPGTRAAYQRRRPTLARQDPEHLRQSCHWPPSRPRLNMGASAQAARSAPARCTTHPQAAGPLRALGHPYGRRESS